MRPDRFAYDFLGCATLLVLYSRAALVVSCRRGDFLACIAYRMPVYLGHLYRSFLFLHIRFAPNADAHMAMHVLRYRSYRRMFLCVPSAVDVGESGRTFRMFLCVRLWTSRREPGDDARVRPRGRSRGQLSGHPIGISLIRTRSRLLAGTRKD